MASSVARKLRKNLTDAERRLRSILRRQQVGGYRFRRQVPIGRYVVDFVCFSEKLIVEVDGGQHDALSERDARRTQWLEERGYRVLRFWNNDVLGNSEGVVDSIRQSLTNTPLPNPPPQGGREVKVIYPQSGRAVK